LKYLIPPMIHAIIDVSKNDGPLISKGKS